MLQQTAAWTDNEGTGARRGSLPPPPLQATTIDCRFSEFPCQLRRPPSLLIPAKDFLQKLSKPFSLAPFLSSYAHKCARCSEREGDCRKPCVLRHRLLSLFSKRRKRSTGRTCGRRQLSNACVPLPSDAYTKIQLVELHLHNGSKGFELLMPCAPRFRDLLLISLMMRREDRRGNGICFATPYDSYVNCLELKWNTKSLDCVELKWNTRVWIVWN